MIDAATTPEVATEAPLEPVSFEKGREHKPRVSAPYVSGKHAKRFWTEAEKDILRTYYPTGGMAACSVHLPAHHSSRTIYAQAHKLGLTTSARRGGGPKARIEAPADIDDILRREYEQQDGKKRGAINAIADKLQLPRWWVTKRATKLGLTMPHKKEPPWTEAEEQLLHKVPLHDVNKAAKIFREHGFNRSPTAIAVRAKRRDLSRRFNEAFSAHEAAKIVGFDSKNFGTYCLSGELKATRQNDKRLPQQGGSRWLIFPVDLRQFVLGHLDRIDLRKVEKFSFVQLLAGGAQEPAPQAATIMPRPLLRWRGLLIDWSSSTPE